MVTDGIPLVNNNCQKADKCDINESTDMGITKRPLYNSEQYLQQTKNAMIDKKLADKKEQWIKKTTHQIKNLPKIEENVVTPYNQKCHSP